MTIKLQNLLPSYFSNADGSELWHHPLVFNQNELIKIVAPSGSGKTSLIHFLYGLKKEYIGDIFLDDKNLKTFTAEEISRLRSAHISVVLQDMRLFDELTVQENIEIKRQLNPFHEKQKIKEMCERLGLGTKLDSKCKNCSYGEQQRTAIIRSLMQPFHFLLLDEPFSHLDNRNAEIAMELILQEATAREATIIFADVEKVDFFPFQKIYHL